MVKSTMTETVPSWGRGRTAAATIQQLQYSLKYTHIFIITCSASFNCLLDSTELALQCAKFIQILPLSSKKIILVIIYIFLCQFLCCCFSNFRSFTSETGATKIDEFHQIPNTSFCFVNRSHGFTNTGTGFHKWITFYVQRQCSCHEKPHRKPVHTDRLRLVSTRMI